MKRLYCQHRSTHHQHRLSILRAILHAFILVALALPGMPAEPAAAAGPIYVDASAAGDGSGTSWANAYTDLQTALLANPAGTFWVAKGTYKPTTGSDRYANFNIQSGMVLYGGFPTDGGDGTFAARDPQQYPTILSGNIGDLNASFENSYHVVTMSAASAATLLDGFTIRDGNANALFPGDPGNRGGGLYLIDSSPILRNLRIEANAAENCGGGMYAYQSSPRIEQVTFVKNTANGSTTSFSGGGGLYLAGTGQAVLQNVTFTENISYNIGGGMGIKDNASSVLSNVRFTSNQAASQGGGLYIGYSSPQLNEVVFEFNQGGDGGGLAIESTTQTKARLVNLHFIRNRASRGGGLSVRMGDASLYNASFLGNTASNGGGVYLDLSSLKLQNALFSGNTATNKGAGISSNYGDRLYLLNTTFASNESSGGTVWSNGTKDIRVYNSILWGASTQIVLNASVPNIDHSIISQTVQPAFIEMPAPGVDATWGTPDDQYGDLHLQPSSTAIDAGNNSLVDTDSLDLDGDGDLTEKINFDLDGAQRFSNTAVTDTGAGTPPLVDIGAYESIFPKFIEGEPKILYLSIVMKH